ncbi:hypothetical protein H6G93_37590 [Nostoc sp. FACHB-973]|nr:hypothetical protein [Nostoc sp. FACHB-973]
MVANVTASNIPLFGSWEIQDINLNVNTPNNSFVVNAKLKTPGSSINLALAFNQGKLTQITASSGIGTDFTFLGAAVDVQAITVITDRNTADAEPWDPEFSLQGAIEIPQLKGLKGTLTDTNKLIVNKDNAYLTGAHLSAADIQLGSWKLRNIQADFDGINKKFYGSAILQTYTGENIGVSLIFDSNGLQNITASNVNFNLFGAKVSNATINFTPDRKPNEGDTWDPEFKLQGVIALPQALGGITVSVTGNDYLLVNNDGFDLTGGKIYKETLDFNLLGFLRVQGKQISLLYSQIGTEKVFIIQGTLILPDLYNLTGNFSDTNNYIKISSAGNVEVVGSISASDINIAAGWKIKTAIVFIDTSNNQTKVTANATVLIPSGIDVAATVLWNGSQLQYIEIRAYNLDKAIGSTGAFLQSIEGKYEGGNTSAFTGKVVITAGAKININLPSWAGGGIHGSLVELDASATITSSYFKTTGNITVLGGLIKGNGNAEINWDKGYLWASSDFNILNGLITTQTQFLATSTKNLYMFGEASVNVPDFIPFIGGTNLGSGEVYVEYTNDGISSNDYVAAWGTVFSGSWWEYTIGIKVSFDGNWQLIHSTEAKTIGQYATKKINDLHNSLDATADKEPQYQIGDKIKDTPVISGKRINGTDGDDILDGDNTNDTISGLKGNDVLFGEDGNDALYGNDGEDILYGGSGNDILNGGVDNDILNGDAGNDTLDGGSGNDYLYGGSGNDIYVVDTTTVTITENINEGTDTIQSSVTFSLANLPNVENLTLTGAAAINGTGNVANNVITGNAGNNIFDGGAGNDTLNGGAGIDTLIGGNGDDIYIVDSTTDMISENPGEGTDTIQSSVTFSLATIANVENLILTGTAAINGTGNAANNVITGNGSNNIIDGGAGNDILNPGYSQGSVDTVNGGDGTDTLEASYTNKTDGAGIHVGATSTSNTPHIRNRVTGQILVNVSNVENYNITGTQYDDIFVGLSGNDIFNGGAGNDRFDSGAGNDILNPGYSEGSVDTIDGGDGTDTLEANYTNKVDGAGIHIGHFGTPHVWNRVTGQILVNVSNVENYNITGTQYDDVLLGFSGNDIFNGGAGNDTLDGGGGNDILKGGAGNDVYVVDTINDSVTENANEGIDTIQSSVTFSLANLPNVENLTLTGATAINGTGNAANNVITGNAGNNILDSAVGNDTLNGGDGNDILTGGVEKDTLTGGFGADRFDYRNLADSIFSSFDIITDFNATTGNDLFLISNTRTGFVDVGSVATLDIVGIAAKLTTTSFASNSAAQFSFGSRTFVAINDATDGFNTNTDAIIEVTDFAGTLGISNFTTT